METTLMYLTGNDSRLAQDLISALSILFLSFFSVEMEDEHETESINPIQSTDGTSGEGVPGLCPPVNDGSGPLQPGKHPEAVCPQRKGIISWMAGRTHPHHRRGSWHIRLRKIQTPGLCPACDECVTGRSRCGIRTGDITPCPLLG